MLAVQDWCALSVHEHLSAWAVQHVHDALSCLQTHHDLLHLPSDQVQLASAIMCHAIEKVWTKWCFRAASPTASPALSQSALD